MNLQRGIDLNLLIWYSRMPSVDENVRTPNNRLTTPRQATTSNNSPGYDFGFDFGGNWDNLKVTIDVEPGFELPTGPGFYVGPGSVVLDSTKPSKVRTMKTPLDGGLGYLDLGDHMDTDNINWDMLTKLPASIALILSPIMTFPHIWVGPLQNWFDSQRMDAS